MILDVLNKNPYTEVYFEYDSRLFSDYQHISDSQIVTEVERTPAPAPVIKSLLESHRQKELLDIFDSSKVIWIYRNVDDVVRSNLAKWPNFRNKIDEIANGEDNTWRSQNIAESTLSVIRTHYHNDLSHESATALFWYMRNKLFFDQHLDQDPRSILVRYEDLVANPNDAFEMVHKKLDLRFNPKMTKGIHQKSVSGSPLPGIAPGIHDLCTCLTQKLDAVSSS